MDEKEKREQMGEVEVKPDKTSTVDIFFPEEPKIKIGDREYTIKTLYFNQFKLMVKLSSVDVSKITIDMLDNILDFISKLLKEPDKEFLEENLEIKTMGEIFSVVRKLNYMGIPKAMGKAKAGN